MRQTILDRQSVEFDDRNLVAQATLGLLSGCERLDDLLQRYAPADGSGEAAVRLAGNDPLLDFVLGLIAFRDRIVAVASEAAGVAPGEVDAATRTVRTHSTDEPAASFGRASRGSGMLR